MFPQSKIMFKKNRCLRLCCCSKKGTGSVGSHWNVLVATPCMSWGLYRLWIQPLSRKIQTYISSAKEQLNSKPKGSWEINDDLEFGWRFHLEPFLSKSIFVLLFSKHLYLWRHETPFVPLLISSFLLEQVSCAPKKTPKRSIKPRDNGEINGYLVIREPGFDSRRRQK